MLPGSTVTVYDTTGGKLYTGDHVTKRDAIGVFGIRLADRSSIGNGAAGGPKEG
jgi:hypothetical protein